MWHLAVVDGGGGGGGGGEGMAMSMTARLLFLRRDVTRVRRACILI